MDVAGGPDGEFVGDPDWRDIGCSHGRPRLPPLGQGVPVTSTVQSHEASTSTVNGPVAPFRFSVRVSVPVVPKSLTRTSDSNGLPFVP